MKIQDSLQNRVSVKKTVLLPIIANNYKTGFETKRFYLI
jgi:hypothetical protein